MVAHRITRWMPVRHCNGSWSCSAITGVLEEAGLHAIDEYITLQQNTLVDSIASQPILQLCLESELMSDPPVQQCWWEQDWCSSR